MWWLLRTVCSAVFVATVAAAAAAAAAEPIHGERMSSQTTSSEVNHLHPSHHHHNQPHHHHHSHHQHHAHQHSQHSSGSKLRQVERLLARHKPSSTSALTAPTRQNHYASWPDRGWPPIDERRAQNSPLDTDHRDGDADLPPYVRKYMRRNRKLIESLERGADTTERYAFVTKMRARPDSASIRWMQANLFEQQKARKKQPQQQQQQKQRSQPRDDDGQQANELPGSSMIASGSRTNASPAASARISGSSSSAKDRVNNFRFHRIATPQLIGAGSYGLMRKQILPFVAITDRRLTSSGAAAAAEASSLATGDGGDDASNKRK